MIFYEELKEIMEYLESEIVGYRYETIDELRVHIDTVMYRINLGLYIENLNDTTKDDYVDCDYQLVCEIKDLNGIDIGFIDIYYLKMRNGGLYITEINVEGY